MTVLTMDYSPQKEMHDQLGVPGKEFERLADEWQIRDYAAED